MRAKTGVVGPLINNFTLTCAPAKIIGWPPNGEHQRAGLSRRSRRPRGDDHVIARPKRVCLYALAAQRCGAGPFHSPPVRLSLFVLSLDVNKGVRIAKYKLHQCPLELYFLFRLVSCTKGMMSVRRRAKQKDPGGEEKKKHSILHRFLQRNADRFFHVYCFGLRLL